MAKRSTPEQEISFSFLSRNDVYTSAQSWCGGENYLQHNLNAVTVGQPRKR